MALVSPGGALARVVALTLAWLLPGAAPAAHVRIVLLTGQSNSLGTTNGTEPDRTPGVDPADGSVLFWWENWDTATPANSIGSTYGGQIAGVVTQQGGAYAGSDHHWGPEFGCARALADAGYGPFALVKCSRGGGGNTHWSKAAGGQMYSNLLAAAGNAAAQLTSLGHTFEFTALLYLQGESDSSAEAALAGSRLRDLALNLRQDLPNAAGLRVIAAGVVPDTTTRSTGVAAQEAAASTNLGLLSFFPDSDLSDERVSDNLHHNRAAKLVVGARFADAVLGRLAHYDASLGGTNRIDPQLQGWSRTLPSSTNGQLAAALTADTNGVNAWLLDDASAAARGYYYSRPFGTTVCTRVETLGWTLTARSRLRDGYTNSGAAWFLQYGNAAQRWLLQVQRMTNDTLVGSWSDAASGTNVSVVLVPSGVGGFQDFTLEQAPGTNAARVRMNGGAPLGSVGPTAASPATLPAGVNWGTASTGGRVRAEWTRVTFETFAAPAASAVWDGGTLTVRAPLPAGRTAWFQRSTNLQDWEPVGTPVQAGAGGAVLTVTNGPGAPPAPRGFYRYGVFP